MKQQKPCSGAGNRLFNLPGRQPSSRRLRPRSRRPRRLEQLEPRQLLASTPLITEFMAVNNATLVDEDGEASDWIEIYNPGDEPVDLGGWHLTDNAANLDKWTFPNATLAPGEYRIVFASGKDRRPMGMGAPPAGEWHTDFALSASGEYLALTDPDGAIVQEFAPQFPQQLGDVSYGLITETDTTLLSDPAAGVRWLVPENGNLGQSWTLPHFDDSAWSSGPLGIGFDTGGTEQTTYAAEVLSTLPMGYWPFLSSAGSRAINLGTLEESLDGRYVGGVDVSAAGPRPPEFDGFAADNHAASFDGNNDAVTTDVSVLSNLSAFTLAAWIRPSAFVRSRVGLFGQNDAIEFGFSSPNIIHLWTPSGGEVSIPYPFPRGEWHHVAATGDGDRLTLYFDGVPAVSGGSNTSNYGASLDDFNIGGGGVFDAAGNYFTGRIDDVAIWDRALSADDIENLYAAGSLGGGQSQVDFSPHLATDVESSMHGEGSGLYVRSEFAVDDPSDLDRLELYAQYDDGIVVYLNGTPVAAQSAPEAPVFSSTATATRSDLDAVEFDLLDLSDSIDLVVAGKNVLAIHVLNAHADNPDLLLNFELEATTSNTITATARYFTSPTPGEPNTPGADDLGPIIANVEGPSMQPAHDEPIVVTADVREAFAGVAGVELVYRVMYDDEVTRAMQDDGRGADATAGDGIFTAVIPPSVAAPGEMVRWYVRAADAGGHASRAPLFADRTGRKQSAEYFGTVIADPSVSTDVAYFQWFLAPGTEGAAQTRSGTRTSVFYLGQFYDNAFVRQRGGSTQSSPKKSFQFEFNPGDHFRFDPDEGRVEEFNLNTTFTDKAYLRQPLAFETYAAVGLPSSVSFPMRVHRNGQFYGVFAFVEQVDDDFLDRNDLDPDGALYKMYNQFLSGTSGVEKKTRRDEGNSDLVSFVNSINSLSGRALANYIFDHVDIPMVLNYLVGTVLVHQNDHPHKNHFLYRDTNGTGEWMFLPWDHDLTFGSNWVGTSFSDVIYADNDSVPGKPSNIRPSHPFIGASNYREWNNHWNRLIDKVLSVPAFREMYLRRLRSVMDDLLGPPGTPDDESWLASRVHELAGRMAPDVADDRARWIPRGWTWGANQSFQEAVDVILEDYFVRRRRHLYVNHSVNNPTYPQNAGIPDAQDGHPPIAFGQIDFNPPGGNQDQEYIELTNPTSAAVDVSGWRVAGGVEFTFRPGTVIPAGGAVYITPDVAAFRARTAGPRGGQGLFVQGDYQGHLSSFGETLRLVAEDGMLVSEITYEGDPSPEQRWLRISEINYHPIPASPAAGELDVDNDQFEFLELVNASATETLDLAGVSFADGIDFEFPAGEPLPLAPGERILIVRNVAAFESRYGTELPVAGEFAKDTGLNNGGERIKLDDASGSTILEFEYDDSDDWPSEADGGGRTLVAVDLQGDYDSPDNWRASSTRGGTPGTAEEDAPTGDYDGSGLVDQTDLDLVLVHWGEDGTTPPTGWIHDLPVGLIDQEELDSVLVNWGQSAAVASHSPPPAAELRMADAADRSPASSPLRGRPPKLPSPGAAENSAPSPSLGPAKAAGKPAQLQRLEALEIAFATLRSRVR